MKGVNCVAKRKPKKLPRSLTKEELDAMYAECDTSTIIGLRNLCAMRLMADCSLRVSEMLSVKPEDINWQTGGFIVTGKGSKERQIYINDELLGLLKELLSRMLYKPQRVICTLEGKPLTSSRYFHEWVARIGAKVGIEKCHPHLFRHTFATDALRSGCDIRMVQEMMGHSDLSTTAVYLHVTSAEKERGFKNLRTNTKKG